MTRRKIHPNGRGTRFVNAALALAAIAIGCAGPVVRPTAPPTVPTVNYRFTIDFDTGGCPTSAVPSVANCDVQPGEPGPRPDCLKVARGETVGFVSAKPNVGFFLQFDPFKHGTFRPPPGGLKVDVAGTRAKPFTFNVMSDPPEKCPPLDPQIIVH